VSLADIRTLSTCAAAPKDLEALNAVLDELNLALERVANELRAALESLKPESARA
jgi:hypothetical protein